MLLSVIIVNYNVKYYVYQCLQSLRRAAKGIEWEVFVVDNNSSDDSVAYLHECFPKEEFPELRIIANADNPGFGKANNQAFRMAQGEYVLCINPDTFVSEDTLTRCLDFMQDHPDAGCMGVKMLNADGTFAPESRRGVPTPWASFCKITRLSKLFPRTKTFGNYYLQYLPIDKPAKIEIVSGAFMMLSKAVVAALSGSPTTTKPDLSTTQSLEQPNCDPLKPDSDTKQPSGLFDEDYFMYCEDTDLSYRMLKAGQNNYYLPTQILHYKGESTRRNTYSYVNNFYKAIFIFFKKHFNSHIGILRVLIYAAIYMLAAFSFVNHSYRQFAYKLKSRIAPHTPQLLCLVSKRNAALVEALAAKHKLNITLHHTAVADARELAALIGDSKPDYIVYDTEQYAFGQILNLAHTLPQERKCYIGSLFPEQKMILTNLHIFTL